jgi:hypothetical protein
MLSISAKDGFEFRLVEKDGKLRKRMVEEGKMAEIFGKKVDQGVKKWEWRMGVSVAFSKQEIY